ncbi:MAG: RHS repeat domain-containing protein, partial [Bacteroidota bacterium]
TNYLAPNGWRYYELVLDLTSNQTVSISGTAQSSNSFNLIDELRLFPIDAQMTTSCYDELYRMHTQTDANGRSLYYEYDESGRLLLTRDQDGNIIQTYEYHYKNN